MEGRREPPQVHGDPGVGRQRGGLPPVAGDEASLGGPGHLAALVHAEERAVVADAADAAGDRRRCRSRRRPAGSPPGRWCRRRCGARRCSASWAQAARAVDVVGVAHAVGAVADVLGGAQDGVHGAERRRLDGEAHVDRVRPRVLDVVADGRAGARPEDQDDGAEARRPARRRPPGRSRPRRGGPPAPAACSRRTAGPARPPGSPAPGPPRRASSAHALQRKTALAQVMPPPNPVSRRWSPSWTRPVSMESYRASGMEADEVLP